MMPYWPWWVGALGLGSVTVVSWFMLGRLLGVSGSWARLAGRGEERELEKAEAPFRQDRAAMEDALCWRPRLPSSVSERRLIRC